MNTKHLQVSKFFLVFILLIYFFPAQAQEARRLTGKKWTYDILEIIKEMDFSLTVLDSLTSQAPENEKNAFKNLRSGVESMLKFIPNVGSTTFEFKRNGDLVVMWEGKQISKGKWKMVGKSLSMQFGDDEDIIKITTLTDNKLVATTENDSRLRLISLE